MTASVITEGMVATVTPNELLELIAAQPVDLIDVRNPDEWQTGYISGARLISLDQFRADPDSFMRQGALTVFICARGVRSMQAAKLAERLGHERLYNLDGGTKEWSRVGMSLVVESRVAA
jgi:rhodanese-related sulfurtransferase